MIHDINLAPERAALNAARFPDLIDLYLSDIARRDQPETARGYRCKLQFFVTWWTIEAPARGFLLSGDDLADFGRWLEGLEISYHTRNDALRRLRQVFRWAFQRKMIPVDLSLDVPTAAGSPPAKTPLDTDALIALFGAASQTRQPVRDCALIAILAGTGARCEEAAAMRVEALTIYADGSGYVALKVTKNDKPRTVAFDAATGRYLRRWLDLLGATAGPLFPSRTGRGAKALTPSGLYKLVVDLATAAGVRDRVRGPHDLRRMFATVWSRRLRGESYGQLLQKQLGHASWATTQAYSLQDAGDILEAMRRAPVSPVALVEAEGRSPVGLIPSEP